MSPLQSAVAEQTVVVATILYCGWGLTNIGLLYDRHPRAWASEAARCALTLALVPSFGPLYRLGHGILYTVFSCSAGLSLLMMITKH